jgi:hypothetical protein
LPKPHYELWCNFLTVNVDNIIISCDGPHFTSFGNKILFEEVLKMLEYYGFSHKILWSDLPLFLEIDPKEALKALEI